MGKFYEFSQSDLASACETVSILINAGTKESNPAGIDWQALIGVLELAIYGSRVDNTFDARLCNEYLSIFFRTEILGGRGVKGGLEIPPFEIPASTNMPDFRQRVDQMSDLDNPASFGMAANADRSLQRINSGLVITTLRQLASAGSMSDEGGGGGGAEIKAWKEQLGPLWKVWDNLMKAQLSKIKGIEVRPPTPEDPPVVAFILMDAAEAARLCEVVAKSLADIQKVVNGTGMSTPEIQQEARFLIRSEVPPKWAKSWPDAPEVPAAYMQALSRITTALKNDWLQRVQSGQLFNKPVCLAEFLKPEVFLNALRQQTARKLGISSDSLHIVSSFEPNLLSDASTSPLPINVQGLILEGCSFDDSKLLLVESTRTSPLTSLLPPLTVAWMSKAAHPDKAVSSARASAQVGMPIYASLSRERAVGEVHIHTESARQRILNAAALFIADSS